MFNNWILFVGIVLWLAQHIDAKAMGWESGRQMRLQYPGESILPLLWHGGIWYDLALTFWLSWLTARHPEWTWWQWTISLSLGFAGSTYMHLKVYAPATIPNHDSRAVVTQEAHVQNGEVTLVGWIHDAFFGIMFGIVINEVSFSKNPAATELWATSAFLVGLLFVGNHMPLGILKALTGKPAEYRGNPLASPIGWGTVMGGAIAAVLITVARLHHMW